MRGIVKAGKRLMASLLVAAMAAGLIVVVLTRIFATHYRWNLPKIKTGENDEYH